MSAGDEPEQSLTPGERAFAWARGHAPKSKATQIALGIVVVAAVVGLVVASLMLAKEAEEAGSTVLVLSLLSVFIASFVGAGGLVVPVPGMKWLALGLTFVQGAVVNPAFVGIAAGIGLALGLSVSFVVGEAGLHALRRRAEGRARLTSALSRSVAFVERHGFAAMLSLSFVGPFSREAAYAAGAARMHFRSFVLAATVGSVAHGLVLAFLGRLVLGDEFP